MGNVTYNLGEMIKNFRKFLLQTAIAPVFVPLFSRFIRKNPAKFRKTCLSSLALKALLD